MTSMNVYNNDNIKKRNDRFSIISNLIPQFEYLFLESRKFTNTLYFQKECLVIVYN
jgi:hypothetical protein